MRIKIRKLSFIIVAHIKTLQCVNYLPEMHGGQLPYGGGVRGDFMEVFDKSFYVCLKFFDKFLAHYEETTFVLNWGNVISR